MKYKFVRNDAERSFTFGSEHGSSKVFKEYRMLYKASDALTCMGTFLPPTKKGYKDFGDRYGISAKAFVNIHNAIMTKQWIDPVRYLSKDLAFRGVNKKPIPVLLKRVHELRPILDQAIKDGNRNITPILFALGKNPKEAKAELGKSLWKQICKNSFTRNNHIAKIIDTAVSRGDVFMDKRGKINTLSSFPSGVLKRGGNSPISLNPYGLWSWEKGCKSGASEHLVRDTERMAGKLGKSFSFSWSRKKMMTKHDQYVEDIQLLKYSPKPYNNDVINNLKFKELSSKGYTATLLDSPKLLHTEGAVMKHCVASYSNSCSKGDYLVYSITKDGERSSTLGIRVTYQHVVGNGGNPSLRDKFIFSQHYKHCNAQVTCGDERYFASYLIELLNKENNNG